jgi:hypothetical protein
MDSEVFSISLNYRMYLSLTQGKKIAKVESGPSEGKYLRIVTPKDVKKLKSKAYSKRYKIPIIDVHSIMAEDEIKQLKRIMPVTKIEKIIEQKSESEYKTMGMLVPVPKKEREQRNIYYIAGPSGCGKSYTSALIIKQWKKLYPYGKIYLFSEVKKDKALDKLINWRVDITDKKMIDKPIEPDEFKNTDGRGENRGSLVIFDDVDTITDKELFKSVHNLLDKLLQTGRHQNIDMIVTSHQLMDYKKTRILLQEAQNVIFFPQGGSIYHIDRFLKIYGGVNKHQLKKILGLPSQWVMFHKSYPQYVLYEHGAFLLK